MPEKKETKEHKALRVGFVVKDPDKIFKEEEGEEDHEL
jgi:hypothetical protein